MSVTCDRGDCGNLHSNRFSDVHGYICNTCFEEICAVKPESIARFMSSNVSLPDYPVDYAYVFSFVKDEHG